MKVTVITPVLNGAKTIADCINSVKMQDYPNIEHLVIDGCSTDGTLDILNKTNIKYISEPDTGIYDAFNKGIFYSKGDLIHILNSDDYYANSNVVSKVVKIMIDGEYDIVHGFVKQVDINQNPVWTIGKDVGKKQLLNKMKVAHPSVFIKKAVFIKYGGFSVGLKIAGDYDFILRIWDNINKFFLPETLVLMRMDGVSNKQIGLSYRESIAVSIIHGQNIFNACYRYYWEMFKHNYIIIPLRNLGFKK
ncbi:MAG: glycosyltransferase [Deltaproteobacteria bacterium]|uniref:glycosyltransferase family 2 protein n=1 Tax=Desulfobacula sp. TaxID=2593537 RepID=UPI001989FA53|nr:glycosyltransferase [Candidatus Desulfobacula maris]MBL6995764.1 glycosyltransferase [Desulfobacula sp.]